MRKCQLPPEEYMQKAHRGKNCDMQAKAPENATERTVGIYLSVAGGAASSRILELREILAAEANIVKESSLLSIKRKYPPLDLWVHGSLCAGKFADGIVGRRLLDRFHIRNRKAEICRTKFNPDTQWNCKLRYRFGCTNSIPTRTNIPKAQPAFNRASNGEATLQGILEPLSPSLQRVRLWPQ